jgi:hypothetical protein
MPLASRPSHQIRRAVAGMQISIWLPLIGASSLRLFLRSSRTCSFFFSLGGIICRRKCARVCLSANPISGVVAEIIAAPRYFAHSIALRGRAWRGERGRPARGVVFGLGAFVALGAFSISPLPCLTISSYGVCVFVLYPSGAAPGAARNPKRGAVRAPKKRRRRWSLGPEGGSRGCMGVRERRLAGPSRARQQQAATHE